MEDHSYLGELTTAIVYLVVGARLARLASRTGETPERILGTMFLFIGTSYVLYTAPIALGLESLWTAFNFAGRVIYVPAAVLLAAFTRRVFRPNDRWAGWLVYAVAIVEIAAVAGSVSRGDWEGFSVSTPWFWPEWAGYVTPLAWAGLESFAEHGRARRRARVGLCEPMVCNRLLLWGVYGLLQVCAWLLVVPQYAQYERQQVFAPTWDVLIAIFEMSAIAVMWLVFFPPAFYRRWVAGAEAAAEGA